MSMFPGAGASVIYNEAGEPLGWDYPSYDDPYDERDPYEDRGYDDEPDWEPPECCEHGDWYANDGCLWRCSWCHDIVPITIAKGKHPHPEEHEGARDWADRRTQSNRYVLRHEADYIGDLL